MAVASRTFHSSGFSFKTIFYSGLGIALVIALFFIPEIIQLNRSSSESSGSGNGMKTLQTAAVAIPKDPKDSQLNRISALIDSGYLEKISNNQGASVPASSADKANSDQAGKAGAVSAAAIDAKAEDGPSWKAIKAKDSRAEVKKAHKEITMIINGLEYDKRGSRFALLNLANGVQQLIDGNMEKTLSASAAIVQIEKLHDAAVKEFMREGVDHVAYQRFIGLDFGPAIGAWSVKLSGRLSTFNPQLTLTNLTVSKHKGESSAAPVTISFQGFVVGDDVERIEMIVGGVRHTDIIPKNVDKTGYRKFKAARFDLSGKVLLKVVDKRGRIYQKLYSFYPRAKIFENRKGRYSIPKPASEFDNRLDRFFTYQVSRQSEVSDSFLETQGFERF